MPRLCALTGSDLPHLECEPTNRSIMLLVEKEKKKKATKGNTILLPIVTSEAAD